jgi:hypothetical protein
MTLAWHFVGDRLRDGRPVPPDHEPLIHTGMIMVCESGLHASLHPFDALQYAPGHILCLVRCEGDIAYYDDKLVCVRRTILARMDATDMLRYYARMRALSVVHLWDAPDVMLDYLMTGDRALRAAAWTAARDSVLNAALNAARDPALVVARDAARSAWAAARNTARDPAWVAARDAARSAWAAAWVAAREAAREAARAAALNTAQEAARAAALNAARDSAWNAARQEFYGLVRECFEQPLKEYA